MTTVVLKPDTCPRCGETRMLTRPRGLLCFPCRGEVVSELYRQRFGTEARERRAVNLLRSGRSMREIGEEFGVSYQRVQQLVRRVLTVAEIAEIQAYWHGSDRGPSEHWPRERMTEFKRAHGLCVEIGCRKPVAKGRFRCEGHLLEAKRRMRRARAEGRA